MQRYFNTEGRCRPDMHYMVRIDERLKRIRQRFVDQGKYFVINRGRQYGKTTTLMALAEALLLSKRLLNTWKICCPEREEQETESARGLFAACFY